ncbi:MAG: cob(I)yrinic acid a,c-diamide adenosyltransferase [Firmicutes bacterium]|nr:cob(I)yrinic acid a,c-diamide adenosyltransferase [Bacillota bacterium]
MSDNKNSPAGLIMVNTGDGKGKTTAALGQALRSLGHGYRVFMIHFMKGREYGEFNALQKMAGLKIVKAGRDSFVDRDNPEAVDIRMAREGLAMAREALLGHDYDLVVLDEINVAMDYNLVSTDDVLEMLKQKPANVDVILTGRNAPAEIIAIADIVSEIKEVKHPYADGRRMRKGIEF